METEDSSLHSKKVCRWNLSWATWIHTTNFSEILLSIIVIIPHPYLCLLPTCL